MSPLAGLRPAERREARTAFAALLLLIAAHVLLETARDALFLADLPAERLPWAYLAIALLALAAGHWNARLLARYPRRRLLASTLVGGALANGLFWLWFLAPRPEALFALYVWTGLLATVAVVQFWLHLGDVFDVGRAKRAFTVIAAGGLAGAVAGSGLANVIVHVASPRELLLASAGLLLVAAALVVARLGSARPLEAAEAAAPATDRSALLALRQDGYQRRVFVVVVLGALVLTGLDYLFKSRVASQVAGAELGTFFARFHVAVSSAALVFQLLLASRLLRSVGVVRSLLVLPMLVAIGSGATAALGGFLPVLLLKGADGTLRHSLHGAGLEILHLPLPSGERNALKALTASLGQRGGQALASLTILGAVGLGLGARGLAVGLCVVSGIWLLGLLGLRSHYVARFRTQIRELGEEVRAELPPIELHSLEELVAALSSPRDRQVLAAIDLLEAAGRARLVSPLILYHPSPRVVLRALEIFADDHREDLDHLIRRLLEHPDAKVRAVALRHHVGREPDTDRPEALLREDPSAAVRCTALVSLLAQRETPEPVALRLVTEFVAKEAPEARNALASSLHQLSPALARLVADALMRGVEDHTGMTVPLARSLAERPTLELLPVLMELLVDPDSRPIARRAILSLGGAALGPLEAALRRTDTRRSVRRHLPRTVSRFGSPRAAKILVDALRAEQDPRVRYKLLRGLGRMRADDPELPIERERLLEVARGSLDRATAMLRLRVAAEVWRTHVTAGSGQDASLLEALLEEKEQRALERVFRILQILTPQEDFHAIFVGLRAADPRWRSTSRELLEHVPIEDALRPGLLALCSSTRAHERLRAAVEAKACAEEDGALAAALTQDPAELPAAEREALMVGTAALLERARSDRNAVLAALAHRELGTLAPAPSEDGEDARAAC